MGWPKGFMRDWLRMNLAGLDPALTGSDARPGTIAGWSLPEFRSHSRSIVPQPDRLAAIEFLAQYGITNGAVAAVRRRDGEIGYVSWLVPVNARRSMLTASKARALVLLAEVFFEALDRVRPSDPVGLLTETERRCLEGAAYGCTDKEIAVDIQRSPETVRFHIKKILKKLGAANRTHAVAVALQRGVIRLGGVPPARPKRGRSKALTRARPPASCAS
jgi:DNA-binding CsgD family transcriptional regulator